MNKSGKVFDGFMKFGGGSISLPMTGIHLQPKKGESFHFGAKNQKRLRIKLDNLRLESDN